MSGRLMSVMIMSGWLSKALVKPSWPVPAGCVQLTEAAACRFLPCPAAGYFCYNLSDRYLAYSCWYVFCNPSPDPLRPGNRAHHSCILWFCCDTGHIFGRCIYPGRQLPADVWGCDTRFPMSFSSNRAEHMAAYCAL